MLRILVLCTSCQLSIDAAAIVGGAGPVGTTGQPIVMIVGSRGNDGILCTGTALARNLVLTSAHCVAPNARLQIMPSVKSGVIAIRAIARHPRYDAQSYGRGRVTADVALIRLAAPLPDSIAPVGLSAESDPVAVGDRVMIAGFGVAASSNDASTGVARVATLIVTGRPGSLQVRLVDPATRGERPGLGACTGDSGGPAFRETDGRLRIIGVISWSTGPGESEGCGGMTGVTPILLYRAWVLEQAAKMGSPLVQ